MFFCMSPVLISGCQLLGEESKPRAHNAPVISYQNPFSDYYLWLKTLDSTQLQAEVDAQEKALSEDAGRAFIKLSILKSLSHSPNFDPNGALSALSQQTHKNTHYDGVFLDLLTNQLLQQTRQLQHISKTEKANKQAELKIKNQQKTIHELEQKIATLQQQISQLKQIERSINGNGS